MNASSVMEFAITRVFDAPRKRVWAAFTKARHLTHP